MLMLLLLLIAIVAGLLFGANLTPLAILVLGAAVALIFSLAAFATAKRQQKV